MIAPPQIEVLEDAGERLERIIGSSELHSAYGVVRSGVFRGRHYEVGDVLLCGGSPAWGSTVILAARGLGRPRLGAIQGGRVLGDRGEACSATRWVAVGRVLAVVRPAQPLAGAPHPSAALPSPAGWVVVSTLARGEEQAPQVSVATPASRRNRPAAARRPPTRTPRPRQLSLFQAA